MSARKPRASNKPNGASDSETVTPPHQSSENQDRLPLHNTGEGGGKKGDSGRRGFNPLIFLGVCFRSSSRVSMIVNILWPATIVMMVINYVLKDNPKACFATAILGMVPAANTVGFAGQELARKLPPVIAVLVETTLGSVVEIILFGILVSKGEVVVARAAILGSILGNMVFCLGLCFIAGGLGRHEQKFHEGVSEVGSGLMLVAGMGLITPTIFAIGNTADVTTFNGTLRNGFAENTILGISRGTAVILLVAYLTYVYYNMSSHHSLMAEIFEGDEAADEDAHLDAQKRWLTMTECIVALAISITFVTFAAVFLVNNIKPLVENDGLPDEFLGLILVPLVEKLAHHVTSIDESFDNMPNLALAHVLGATLQTALLNAPIAIFVGWASGTPMDLNFKLFEAAILIISIIMVGNFLRDGKSNYLEGVLCVLVYLIIALCAWYFPNPGLEEELLLDTHTPEGYGTSNTGSFSPSEMVGKMLMGRR